MSVSANTILRVVGEVVMPATSLAQNVFYTKFLDDGGSNDDQDVIDDCAYWVDQIYNELTSQMSTLITPGECVVYQWDPIDLDWDELGSAALSDVFAGAGDMLPHGVAAVVTGRTVDPDVNGRKFFPGFVEAMCSESAWSGTALTALALAGAEWVTPYTGIETGSGFAPGVWSTVQSEFKAFVINYIINAIAGYQRRRKPGVGI